MVAIIVTLVGLIFASIVPLAPAAATGGIPNTLEKIWETTFPPNEYASSVVYQGPSIGTLMVSTATNLTGYNASTGALKWSFSVEATFGLSETSFLTISSDHSTGNVVLVVDGNTLQDGSYTSYMFAVAEDGSVAWETASASYWPTCVSNNQYAVCPGESETVFVVALSDGRIVSNTLLRENMDIIAVVGTSV